MFGWFSEVLSCGNQIRHRWSLLSLTSAENGDTLLILNNYFVIPLPETITALQYWVSEIPCRTMDHLHPCILCFKLVKRTHWIGRLPSDFPRTAARPDFPSAIARLDRQDVNPYDCLTRRSPWWADASCFFFTLVMEPAMFNPLRTYAVKFRDLQLVLLDGALGTRCEAYNFARGALRFWKWYFSNSVFLLLAVCFSIAFVRHQTVFRVMTSEIFCPTDLMLELK